MTVLLFGFGMGEIAIVVVVLFLLFGASRLPELAKSLGQTRKAFKDGMREVEEEELMEREKKMLSPTPPAPVNNLSDEDLMAEMRRRVEQKQS